jgi:hypothetical protein
MATQKQYDCKNTDKKTTQKAYQKDGKQRIRTTTQITRDCAVFTETNEGQEQEDKEQNPEEQETENDKLFNKLTEHFTK